MQVFYRLALALTWCALVPSADPTFAQSAQNATAVAAKSDKPAADKTTADKSRTTPPPAATRVVVEARPSRKAARSKGDITFDDLKFDIEKGGKFEESMLTPEIKSLSKQTVRLRGYMLPNSVYKSSGIEQFVLVRDNMECCFGPGAAIYDCVLVNMEKGKTTDFTTKPIAVRGKFEIEEFKFPDGTLAAIYKMTASEAK